MSRLLGCGEHQHAVQNLNIEQMRKEFDQEKKEFEAQNINDNQQYRQHQQHQHQPQSLDGYGAGGGFDNCQNELTSNDDPTFGDKEIQLEILKRSLSFNENPYLLCRWKYFLQHLPTKPLIIKVYNFERERPKEIVRRKILKGQLYGKNFEFLPTPWFRDPRL